MAEHSNPRQKRQWQRFCESANDLAAQRWKVVTSQPLRQFSGAEWETRIRERLSPLCELEILRYGEHCRIQRIQVSELSAPGRSAFERLIAGAEVKAQQVTPISIAAGQGTIGRRGHGLLQFNPGRRLLNGQLSLLVFIDEATRRPLNMNIQLQGICPVRWQSVYLRYDLDAVQMGSGPAAHCNAHWHQGALPEASDAEDHDPRLPSAPLDPDLVLDHLVLHFFPKGPDDVLPNTPELNDHHAGLGTRLREAREGKGLELHDAAELTEFSHSYLRDIELGERMGRDVSIDAIARIAHALDHPAAALAFGASAAR